MALSEESILLIYSAYVQSAYVQELDFTELCFLKTILLCIVMVAILFISNPISFEFVYLSSNHEYQNTAIEYTYYIFFFY